MSLTAPVPKRTNERANVHRSIQNKASYKSWLRHRDDVMRCDKDERGKKKRAHRVAMLTKGLRQEVGCTLTVRRRRHNAHTQKKKRIKKKKKKLSERRVLYDVRFSGSYWIYEILPDCMHLRYESCNGARKNPHCTLQVQKKKGRKNPIISSFLDLFILFFYSLAQIWSIALEEEKKWRIRKRKKKVLGNVRASIQK